MVVTRKVRGVKKDGEPTASTSTEAAMDEPKDLAAVDIENIGIDEEDIKAPDDIKEEDGEKNREKRTPKPSFKVKYASQKLAGKKTGWRKYERKYKPEWEEQFTWVERSPDQTEMAFCIMCRDVLEPRYNGLVKHEATVKHKARERGEPMPPGQLAATEAFLASGGRRYRTVWESDFPWVRRAPGDNASQNAYCTVCHEILLPKYNSLLKHQATLKHQANLESGSSYAKLQNSPAVANAYFREEWRDCYPWVTTDPSGNPGLAYCTVCCKSLTAKKYVLSMHQQKAKHIKRAGMTPEEVNDLLKRIPKIKDPDAPKDKRFYERKYRPAWEREFPFISKAPDSSEYAYCKLCRDYLAPKVNDIRKHMYTMKHRKRAIASGFNGRQDTVTLVAGTGQPDQTGLKVVQVPGSTDFTVVPVDSHGQVTTTEVVQVVEAAPPNDGVVVAIPSSLGEADILGDGTTIMQTENPGMLYHRSLLQEGLKDCFSAELHSDIKMITNDGGQAILHQLVLAASSPLLRKAILNIDPAGRAADEPLTILLPDFSTDDLNTLLPWLYGDGSDEQQPDFELVKALAIGQPQTFMKATEGDDDVKPFRGQFQGNFDFKPEMDPRVNPMDPNNLFSLKDSDRDQDLEEFEDEDTDEEDEDTADEDMADIYDSDDEGSSIDGGPEEPNQEKQTTKIPGKSTTKILEKSEKTLETPKTPGIVRPGRKEIMFPKTPERPKVTKIVFPSGVVPGTSERAKKRPLVAAQISEKTVSRYVKRPRKTSFVVKQEPSDEYSEDDDESSKADSESELDPDSDNPDQEDPYNPLVVDFPHFQPKVFMEKLDTRDCVRKISNGLWQCLLCFRQMKKCCEMLGHIETHTGCHNCGKCFAGRNSSTSLKRHLKVCLRKMEKKAKPLKICDYCGKGFQFKSRLALHLKECKRRPRDGFELQITQLQKEQKARDRALAKIAENAKKAESAEKAEMAEEMGEKVESAEETEQIEKN